MENSVRSQRTRDAVIDAALTIIMRDGQTRLTIDAIVRECGISKGGVLHQFRTKEAVLKALMDRQIERSDAFFDAYLADLPADRKEPVLEAQIRTLQIAADHPKSTTFALVGTFTENPEMIAALRDTTRQRIESMKQEAADPRMALLRWSAAQGLALSGILGLCPLVEAERLAVFDFLRDERAWQAMAATLDAMKPTPSTAKAGKKSG